MSNYYKGLIIKSFCSIIITFTIFSSAFSQDLHCINTIDINKLKLKSYGANSISGLYYSNVFPSFPQRDCYTGVISYIPPFLEYPKNSKIGYSDYISLWFGGIVKTDTLVSNFLTTDIFNNESIEYKSILKSNDYYSVDAISELDIIESSADTFDLASNPRGYFFDLDKYHLGIQIFKNSYIWSFEYAEDIIIFNIIIKNINSNRTIKDFYIGIEQRPSIGYTALPDFQQLHTLSGFIDKKVTSDDCDVTDVFNIMWSASIDGDPVNDEYTDQVVFDGEYDVKSCTDSYGLFFLDYPVNKINNRNASFNWWTNFSSTYFPQKKESYRDLSLGLYGHNKSDEYRYHLLSNGEIDFDPIFTGTIHQNDSVWVYPPQEQVEGIVRIPFVTTLLSVGPYDLEPGEEISFPIALVMGEDFHTDPTNYQRNLPDNPDAYYQNLDFTDLFKNARWAKWIYDNPGVDTDGDGYAGEQTICIHDSVLVGTTWVYDNVDTIYYTGDGVPDWKAAGPPQPPVVKLEPIENGVKIRFNGTNSEMEPDIFSGKNDFEGYNVYYGLDEREESMTLVASYDREDYNKYAYEAKSGNFVLKDDPFTVEQLRCLYSHKTDRCADTSFHPDKYYNSSTAIIHPDFPDSVFYFLPHRYNVSEYGDSSPIVKVYPNALDPRGVPVDSLTEEYYTDDGYFKFFEYEYILTDLLPSLEYYASVTAFDYGSPTRGLQPLESSKSFNM
ncbi:MAG: hypothetical protein DWP97_01455, partial [Calditrichaeota bacterium]